MSTSTQPVDLGLTPESSNQPESTFGKFYTSDKYEEIADGLRGPEFDAFVDLLDEVRFSSDHPGRHLDQSVSCSRIKIGAHTPSKKSGTHCGASAANEECSQNHT